VPLALAGIFAWDWAFLADGHGENQDAARARGTPTHLSDSGAPWDTQLVFEEQTLSFRELNRCLLRSRRG